MRRQSRFWALINESRRRQQAPPAPPQFGPWPRYRLRNGRQLEQLGPVVGVLVEVAAYDSEGRALGRQVMSEFSYALLIKEGQQV